MNQSLSWIDPQAVRALLERVGPSPTAVEPTPPLSSPSESSHVPPLEQLPASPREHDAADGDDLELEVRTSATSTESSGTDPAVAEPAETGGGIETDPNEFSSDAADALGRLRDLVVWAMTIPDVMQVFVCNAEGLVISQRNADPELVASSSWLITSWERVERFLRPSGFGVVGVELEGDTWLSIMPGAASWGAVYLGLVTPTHTKHRHIGLVRSAFVRVLKEEQHEH